MHDDGACLLCPRDTETPCVYIHQIKQIIENKRKYYISRQKHDDFDFGVLYACDIFLKHIDNINEQLSS